MFNKNVLSNTLLTTVVLICSLSFSLESRGQTPIDPPQTTSIDGITNIAVTLDTFGRPSIEAKINGIDVTLRVDLGSNAFALSETGLKKLNLRTAPSDISEMPNMAVVNEMKIGTATFTGMSAVIIPLLNGYGDGLIGYPTFKELLVTFDFPNKRLILEKGELPRVNNEDILKWIGEDVGNRPDVNVDINGITKAGVLDTQGSGWLKMPNSYLTDIPTTGNVSNLRGQGPTLGEMEIQRVRVNSDMKIGKYVVKNPIIFFRNKPGIVIGSAFLNHFAITLDQKNDRIKLTKQGSNVITVPKEEWEKDDDTSIPNLEKSESKSEYAGVYNNRSVSYENGELFLQRTDASTASTNPNERVSAPKLLMVRSSNDEFYLDRIPQAKMKFVRDHNNKVIELHVLNPQGKWEVAKKKDG